MKKIFATLIFALLLSTSYSQSYTVLLEKLNVFLKTFDNNWYGHLEIKNGMLYDYYKDGTYSRMNINDILNAQVVEQNRKVEIFCKDDNLCVSTATRGDFSRLPFSANANFDAADFAAKLNALITTYKNQGSQRNNSSNVSSIPSSSTIDFPVGTKVRVTTEGVDFLDVVFEEADKFTGIVVGSNLEPLGGGFYSGRIRMDNGTVKQYPKAKFQVVK